MTGLAFPDILGEEPPALSAADFGAVPADLPPDFGAALAVALAAVLGAAFGADLTLTLLAVDLAVDFAAVFAVIFAVFFAGAALVLEGFSLAALADALLFPVLFAAGLDFGAAFGVDFDWFNFAVAMIGFALHVRYYRNSTP